MAIATFTPPRAPNVGTEDAPKVSLLKAEFGDGYTQATAAGINHIRRIISLEWEVLTPTQAKAMTDFFVAQGGYKPFWWTPSNEATPLKWTCEEWKDKRDKGGLRTVSATFIQSFNLVT
jgi:phage-related protein